MAITCILGGRTQDAFVTVAEADDLLTGTVFYDEGGTTWENLTTAQKEKALRETANDVAKMPWVGEPLFAYQSCSFPTDVICYTRTLTTNSSGCTTTSIVCDDLDADSNANYTATELLYGAVHIAESNTSSYAEYGNAARVSVYALSTGTLTLDTSELVAAPNAKDITVVWPLPREIRRAFAIQAWFHGCSNLNMALKDAIHMRQSGTIGPGGSVSFSHGGVITHWQSDAWAIINKYIRKSVEARRE